MTPARSLPPRSRAPPFAGAATCRDPFRTRNCSRMATSAHRRLAHFLPTAMACTTPSAMFGSGPGTGTARSTRRRPPRPAACLPIRADRRSRRATIQRSRTCVFRARCSRMGHISVRAELLPSLPARRALPASGRHIDESRRVPLHPPKARAD